MEQNPFGNLLDWQPVLNTLEDLSNNGALTQFQPELIRILRHKGNWRLREKVLEYIGEINNPSTDLLHEVLAILDDDNTYYDARIIAANTLVQMLRNVSDDDKKDMFIESQKIVDKLKSTPQPFFFVEILDRLYSTLPISKKNEK